MERVASTEDLLRLTETADMTALEGLIASHTTLSSAQCSLEVEPYDGGVLIYMSRGRHIRPHGLDLGFPFTLEELWREVADLDRNVADAEAADLPLAYRDSEGGTDAERTELLTTLAFNWRLSPDDLVEAIGEGWTTIDVEMPGVALDEDGDLVSPEPIWLISGDPPDVAIGITGTLVWIAVAPKSEPHAIDVAIQASVLRDTPDFLQELSRWVAEARGRGR